MVVPRLSSHGSTDSPNILDCSPCFFLDIDCDQLTRVILTWTCSMPRTGWLYRGHWGQELQLQTGVQGISLPARWNVAKRQLIPVIYYHKVLYLLMCFEGLGVPAFTCSLPQAKAFYIFLFYFGDVLNSPFRMSGGWHLVQTIFWPCVSLVLDGSLPPPHCSGFTVHLLYGNIHTDDMEASAGLMIVTGPSESVLLTHTYITPACGCVSVCAAWQVFSGWRCGCLCIYDRQEGLSSRRNIQKQHFCQHSWNELNQRVSLSSWQSSWDVMSIAILSNLLIQCNYVQLSSL